MLELVKLRQATSFFGNLDISLLTQLFSSFPLSSIAISVTLLDAPVVGASILGLIFVQVRYGSDYGPRQAKAVSVAYAQNA